MGAFKSDGVDIREGMEPYLSGSNVNSASLPFQLAGVAADSGYAKSFTDEKLHERASFGKYSAPSVFVAKKGYLSSKTLLTSISSASTHYLVYDSATDSWYLSSTSGSASGVRLSANGNRRLFHAVLVGGGGGGGGGRAGGNSGGGGGGGATFIGYLLLNTGADSEDFPTNTKVVVGAGGATAEWGVDGSNGTSTRIATPTGTNRLLAMGGNGGTGGDNADPGKGGVAQDYVYYVSPDYFLKSVAGGAGGDQTKVGKQVVGGSMFELRRFCGPDVISVSYSGGIGGAAPQANGGGGGGASAFGKGGDAGANTTAGTKGSGGAGGGNAWFQGNPGSVGGDGYFAIYY